MNDLSVSRAAFERSVYATKSFLISLALMTQRLSVEEAATIANVEVLSQIETWGMVEDSQSPSRFLSSLASD